VAEGGGGGGGGGGGLARARASIGGGLCSAMGCKVRHTVVVSINHSDVAPNTPC
jgi:hypothetical protein